MMADSNAKGLCASASGQTEGQAADFASAWAFSYLLWAVVLVAAIIRLYRLDHFSFWLDEILQSFFIHGTWKEFWETLRSDAFHPPLD